MTEKAAGSKYRWSLLAIIVFSVAVRWFLVFQGGQNYWPDEARYARAKHATQMMLEGNIAGAMPTFDAADHMLFKVAGIVPALFEIFVVESWRVPGMFYSSFFALTLFLLWRILRRVGVDAPTALASAALLAGCNSFFLYSRHLIPYDIAMAIGLWAVYIGLRPRPGIWTSIGCGLVAGITFLTYTGYWTLGAFAVFMHVFYQDRQPGLMIRKLIVASLACIFPTAFLCGLSTLLGGKLVASFDFYSHSVTQGDYGEGWSLPFVYLWHTEHLNLLLWAAAGIFGVWALRRTKHAEAVKFALTGFLFFYVTMTVFSVFLHKFVVYGRLSRQLVPFLCVITAAVLVHAWNRFPKARMLTLAAAALIAIQSAYNFYQPFRLIFPIEFRQEMLANQQNYPKGGQYDLLNADHIFPYPIQSNARYQRAVFQKPHPLEYLPYQYEGFTPEQRQVLRKTDISMRLMLKE